MESRQHLLNLTTVELVNMIIDLEEKVEELQKENGLLLASNKSLSKTKILTVDVKTSDLPQVTKRIKELEAKVEKLKAGVWLVANAELREENQKLKETNFKLLGRLSNASEYIQKLEEKIHKLEN